MLFIQYSGPRTGEEPNFSTYMCMYWRKSTYIIFSSDNIMLPNPIRLILHIAQVPTGLRAPLKSSIDVYVLKKKLWCEFQDITALWREYGGVDRQRNAFVFGTFISF